MKTAKPVYWHQGLFLQPQHFQVTDQRLRDHLLPFMDNSLPYFWGVRQMEIQTSALTRGVVQINSMSLAFRDGTHAEFPGNAAIAPRSFDEQWTFRDKPLTIYAGLRRFRDNTTNVTVVDDLDSGNLDSRFLSLSEPEEIPDLYGDGPSASVKTLFLNVRLFWEHEIDALDHYDVIPIARVLWEGGSIKISPTFVPPCVSMDASWILSSLVEEIRNECSSRARQLGEFKNPRDTERHEMDARYMVYLLALQTLNRYVPILHHYSETKPLHPWTFYGTLRQMVGEMSTFSEKVSLLGESDGSGEPLPPYNHNDIGGCLIRAQALIFSLLNELTVGPDVLVRLHSDGEYYEAQLSPSFFSSKARYYFVVTMGEDPDAGLRSFVENSKCGAPSLISTIIQRALPGVELVPLTTPPQGLPRRFNAFYFRIETNSGDWEAIRREESIRLFWPDAPPEGVLIDMIGVR